MRYWVFCALLCVLVAALPASALAGWGAPEPVGSDINQIRKRSVVWVLGVVGQVRVGSAPPCWWAVSSSRR
jgi:hypothetical protein